MDPNEKLEEALGHRPKTLERQPQDSAKTVKTEAQDSEDRGQDSAKTPPRQPKRQQKDSTSVLHASSPSVLEEVSSDVSVLEQKLIPRKERSDTLLTEADLKAEREKMGKIQVAEEMLSAGWSVRETALETRLPKSLIEKISKKLSAASESRPRGYRAEWNDKPYKEALAREENEEDTEGLLSSGWIEKIQRKIWKMKIEQSLMKKAGLIGDVDGDEKKGGSIDLNQILLAKVVASGGNINGQELISFATALKGLFAPQQTDNFMEKYSAMENLKDSAVLKHNTMQAQAFAAAKSETDRNFTRELINKGLETISPVLKSITTKPANIPEATASIPPPMQVTQAELEALNLPPPHVSTVEPVAELIQSEGVPLEDTIGYTNISKPDLSKKTELGR